MSQELQLTLALLCSLQQERGLALYACKSHDKLEDEALERRIAETDALWQKLETDFPELAAAMPHDMSLPFAGRRLSAFRIARRAGEVAELYMFQLEHPIYMLTLSALTDHPSINPSQTSALIHYLAALNYLCQLRDLGFAVYARGEITPTDTLRMKKAASSYLARDRLFLGLADENLRQTVEQAKDVSLEILSRAHDAIGKIQRGYAKGVLAETPMPSWFRMMDSELVVQQQGLQRAIVSLQSQGPAFSLANAPGQALDGDVEHELPAIMALPLFRGLPETAMRNLLKGARFFDLEKNQTFMTQGEPLTRFFVVIDGWAKVYKTTDEGEESVLQLVSKKDCILDNGYAPSGLAAVSAKSVTKVRVLGLSLPVMRDHVSRNRELVQNLFAATTSRLQKLVGHFEQITLRTATQRVGWFLVNLHLETGLEGAPLALPFEKALIASYLNIKPETFSRVLKQFRDRGFVIEKDRIIMPDVKALCDFCDPDMAVRCCRAEAFNCAPILAARRAEGR